MPVYRVLVAHRGLKVNQWVTLDDGERLVRAGYLRKVVEEVRDEPVLAVHADSPEPAAPRRGRKPKASEVTGEPDRAEQSAGVPDSEGESA